jgi:hypothetical protein
MSETTATSRPFQKLLSSISFNVVFATPKPSNGQMHHNGSQGGSVASGDGGDSAGCGGDGSSGVASGAVHGMRREISISAADLDDADVPSSFHVRVRLLNFVCLFVCLFLFLFLVELRCCSCRYCCAAASSPPFFICKAVYIRSKSKNPDIIIHILLLLLLHPDTCLCRL